MLFFLAFHTLLHFIFCKFISLVISITMVSSSLKSINTPRTDNFIAGLINQKQEEKMVILSKRVIQPWYLDPSLLKSYKPYNQICQASLKELFTTIPDRTFQTLVKEFYLNLRLEKSSLRTSVKGMEIPIHKDHFRRIFDLPSEGMTYTLEKPTSFKNFKHSIAIIHLVINPMTKMKVPFKATHQKPKVKIFHYLITIILFLGVINHNYVVMKDVVSL